ncbi:hypothetical protein TNCV_4799221 [Trichonephila clavipes]|nr:hypothetical protein TNCV_4799221 [Trichonephila clavipes]
MSSFLVWREGDNRNRWHDGQVCPDVGQGIMAPWARRLGCVLACYAQIGRGRPRDFCPFLLAGHEGRVVNTPLVFKRVFFQGTRREKKRLGVLEGAGLKPLAAIKDCVLEGVGGALVRCLPRNELGKPRSLRNPYLDLRTLPTQWGICDGSYPS